MQKQHAAQKAQATAQPGGTPSPATPQGSVKGEIDASQKQVASMQSELQKLDQSYKKAEAENKELKTKLEKALEAVQQFNKEFDAAKNEIQKLTDQNKNLVTDADKAKQQVQMQKEQLEQQRAQFQQQQQTIQKGTFDARDSFVLGD